MKHIKMTGAFLISACFIFATLISVLTHCQNLVFVFAKETTQIRKVYCDATLEDDFEDDSIIVILSSETSNYRGISAQVRQCFDDVGVKSITELSALPEDYVNLDGSVNEQKAPGIANHFTKEYTVIIF